MKDPFEALFGSLQQPTTARIPGVAYKDQPKPKRERVRNPAKTKQVKLDHPGDRPDKWDANPVVLPNPLGDGEMEFFTLGQLGKAIGRGAVTIRGWESKGWFPDAVFRSPAPKNARPGTPEARGKRLYSRFQVELVLRCANETGVLALTRGRPEVGPAWSAFKKRVEAEWRAELL